MSSETRYGATDGFSRLESVKNIEKYMAMQVIRLHLSKTWV